MIEKSENKISNKRNISDQLDDIFKKMNSWLNKYTKWFDWLFFVFIIGLMSLGLHLLVLFIYDKTFTLDAFYAEYCFFIILLIIDAIRNAFYYDDKLNAIKLTILAFALFMLIPGAIIYGSIMHSIYILDVDIINSQTKIAVTLFSFFGLLVNIISVLAKGRA